jgi:YgiT-type zinc finger domain-containing protein
MSNPFTCCITCHSEKINKVRGAFPVAIHDKTWKVPNIEYYVCTQCGEKFMDLDNESKIDAYLKNKNLHVASKS